MQFKQIAAVKVGDKYDVVVFALSEEGDIYSYHTHAADPSKGKWKRVTGPDYSSEEFSKAEVDNAVAHNREVAKKFRIGQ